MTNGWNTKKVAAMRRSSGGGAAHWCVGAALLTLAALTFVPPAQAQTSEVLLSNLQQPNFSGGGINFEMDSAQMFTTGGEATGYKLTSVDLSIRRATTCPHTVSVYRANSNFLPDGLVESLSRGVTITMEANYTASGDGIDLDPSTRYSIVVDSTTDCSGTRVNTTRSDGVDEAAPGWTIRSQGHQRDWDKTRTNDWGTTNSDNALRIAIHGHVIVANTAPTASPGAVTTLEDTAHAFSAADFNFSDMDADDILAAVNIVTLPSKGTLALSGTAVTAGDSIDRTDLDAGNLTYTPPANDHGDNLASFTFKVSDGTAESAGGAVMTINVTAVNDVPTGTPAIVGDPIAGVTLTLDLSAIMDADGLREPSEFKINWYHTDNDAISIANTMSYELNVNNVGKTLRVEVGFTDVDGEVEEVVLQMWPETGTIAPALTLSVSPTTIYEDPGTATVTIDSVGGATHDAARTITLSLAGGTATEGTDYTIASKSLTLAASTASVTTTITALTDTATEGDETVLVTATTLTTTIGSQQTVTIKDPPALTAAVISMGEPLVEGGEPVIVAVELSGAPGREVEIPVMADPYRGATVADYTFSGYATTPASVNLTFGPGETRKEIVLTATDDTEADFDEAVRFYLDVDNLPPGITRGGGTFLTKIIVDNDFEYEVSLVGGTALAVDEAAGTLTTMVLVGTPGEISQADLAALNETVTLTVSTADGTATAGQDYTALSAQTLTFAASDFSQSMPCGARAVCQRAEMTVSVPITDDAVHEGATPETFTLTLSHGSDQRVTYPSGETATASITDDDQPALTFSVAPATILEDGGTATVTLAASNSRAVDVIIALSLAGTATEDMDYTIDSKSLTLPANSASVTATVTATADSLDDNNETVEITARAGGNTVGTPQTVTISQAPPTLSLAVSQTSIAEAVGTSTVTVSTAGTTFDTDQTIMLNLAGTATQTDDYTVSSTSLTLPANATSVTATVMAVQDTIDEPDETVLITASHDGSTIGPETVTITDDDAAPTLSVTVSADTVAEAAGTSTVTVSASGTTFATVQTIMLNLDGTATQTDDYTISAESLTLAAGAMSVTATVMAVQDTIDEVDETVLITASHNNSDIGTQQTVTITDDDAAPTLTVSVSADTVAEAAGTSTVTVSASGTTFATVQTIMLNLDGTATQTDDYTISAESLTLAAGAMSVTATVMAVQDTIDEVDETVLITASHNNSDIGTQQTVTITDDDAAPTLTVSVSADTVAEAAGTSTVTVSASGTTFATVQTIMLNLDGTATQTDDYTISAESLTLAAGATSVTATVTAVQDTIDEADETVLITASLGGSDIGTQQTVTITDDDAAPTLTVSVSADTIGEAGGTSTVIISTGAGPAFGSDQTITLELAGTATEGTDYTIDSKMLTLAANTTSVSATITATADSDDDNDETILITASHDSTTIGTQQTVTISETAPALTVTVSPAAIDEAAGTSTLTVSASSAFGSNQTIVLALSGTATKGDDYTIGAESLTLTAGQTSVTTTVTAVQDNIDDDAETVLITASHNNSDIGTQQTVTITDDDATPTLTVSVNPASIAENAGTSTVTVSTGTTTFAGDQMIALALSGTATKGDDYTIGAELLTLTAGQSSVTATVTAVDDLLDDDAETVVITASAGGTTIGTAQTITITDDDDAPALTVSVSPASIAENAGTSTVTVGTGGSIFTDDQTITLALTGTATQTDDYTIGAESLTLTAGETSVTTTVTAVQDSIDDDAETVVITASAGGTPIGSATMTITDDDATPVLTVSVNPAMIAEAAGTSTVTVGTGGTTFTGDQTIMLNLAGTATKGDDYTIGAESLTLAAGQTSVTTTVSAVQDIIDDDAETVIITASNGTSTIGSATVTITDDDATPVLTVSVNPAMIAEAAGGSTVTVGTGGTAFASVQTIALEVGGTATKGDDYTIGAESLTLAAGQTSVTTTVTAVQDIIDDDAETVIITASNGTSTIGSATVTITDDDATPVLTVSVNPAMIAEAAGTSTVTVGTGGTAFASVQTIALEVGGTATKGDDYTIGAESLTLAAGQTSVTTTVTAVQDIIDDDAETVIITASNGTSTIGSATITITDDDAAPVMEFTLSPDSVAEAAGTSRVTVGTGTGSTFATDQAITLTVSGTAAEIGDYTIGSKSLTLPAGSGTAASSIATTITAVQDRIDDDAETVVITATHNSVDVGTARTITITDDDSAPVLSLGVSSAVISEAAGTSRVTVGTGAGSTFETDQALTLTLGGTATVNDDYTIGSTTLTLPAGAGSAVSEITTLITAVDDDFFEGTADEQLTVAGTRGSAPFGATRTVTILENEDAPKLTLTLADGSISEDGGSTTVTAGVSPRTVDAFTVSFAVTPSAPATAADYDLAGTLAFAALSATPTGTVTITTNNNRVDRPDKTVSVTGTGSEGYFRATDAVTLTIADEDAAPAPVLEVGSTAIAENAGASTVTVTTGTGSTFPAAMTVFLTMTGSAGEDADYAIVSKSLTLPAGSGLDVSTVTTTVTGVDDIIDDDAEDILIDAAIGMSAVGTRQTVTIDDDDAAPVLEISLSDLSIAENGGTSTVTVGTGTGSTFATDQAIELSLSGTAADVSDYSLDTTLTLPAGVGVNASTVTATVTGVDDRIDDDAETILIDGERAGADFGTRRTVTIDDDDAAPVLVLTAQPASIAENGGVSTVTVGTGTGSTFATEQTVTLAVDGTAIEGADYTIASRTLTLPAGVGSGAASVATPVTGLDDGVFEGEEDQTVLVSATHGGAPVGTARVAVVDDEANSQVVLALSQASIPESGGNSQITASVSPPAEHAFVVDLEVGPNEPAKAADFTTAWPVPSLGLLDFAAGATRSTGLAFIYAVNNEVDTPDKTLTVSGGISGFDYDTLTVEPAATTGIRAPASLALTIRDDDEAADTLSLSLDAASVAEDAGATDIGVTATLDSGARESAVAVTVTVGGGTGDAGAESGIDFAEVAAFTITIPAGDASASASFPLTPVDDRIDEVDEALSVTGATDNPLIGVPEAAALTITDNDDAPEPTFAVQPATIGENGGTATVTVTTGTGSTFADERTIALSVTGTATAGEDYTISSQALTLPAGVGAGASSVTATVAALDDDIDDDAETIVIGALLDGVALGAAQTVTIDDDEGPPLVTLLLTPPSIAEDGGVGTVTATVSPASATAFTVEVSSAPVSPAEAGDFGQSGTTLSFAAGAAASTGSVTIAAVDDTADTPNLEVSVSGTVSSPGVTAPADATLTILDDDAAAVLALEVDATTIAEDGGAVTVTVSTGTGSTFDTDQAITLVLGGTATGGEDYTVSATELNLPAGASSVTATVTALDDDVFEGGETVLISGLHNGEAFGIGRTVTIDDDEAVPEVTLVLNPDSIGEDGGVGRVTATLSAASTEPFTVTVAAAPDAPAVAGDFALSGGTLSFAAGATASTGEVTITAVNNGVDTADKTLRVSGVVSLDGVAAPAEATLTIIDDDEAPELTLEVLPATIAENGGTATVTVTTGTGSTFADEQTIALSVSGTATTGADYTISSTSLTLPAGAGAEASIVTATVTAVNDNVDDDAETIVIGALLDGVAFGAGQTVTIADDDGTPVVTLVLTPPSIAEDGGASTVTATVSPASATAFTVAVASAPVSPAEAGDFGQSGTTLSFAAGAAASTGSVTIGAVDNTADTPNLQISVSGTVSSPGVSAPADATLTILDDDAAAVLALEVDATTIAEDGGAVTVTVSTGTGSTFDTDQAITLVLGGTATGGEDYTVSATELNLPAGASSVTATVTALDDDVFEGGETVLISGLHNGEAFGIGRTVTIDDDEAVPEVTLVLNPDSIDENGGVGRVTATLSSALTEPFTVAVAVEPDAPAVPGDYVLSGATLSFASGATASTGGVTITAVDNDVDTADKTLRVSGTASREDVSVPEDAALMIVDDDEASSTVTLTVAPQRVGEGAAATVIEVTGALDSGARDSDTVILLSAGGGESAASAGVDYVSVADFSLTIPANGTSATATFTLAPLDDRIDEADEAVFLTGTAAGDAGIGVPEAVGITITDDDEAPVLALGVDPARIAENGGTATVTVTTGGGSTFAEERTITLEVAGTATRGGDYRLESTTVRLPAGTGVEASTATAALVGLDDGIAEADETILIGATLDGIAIGTQQTVTIEDDEGAPLVTLVLTPDSIGEDGGVGRVTATVAPASAEAFTVTVSALAVEPGSSSDFTLDGATLSFAADATESTGGVTITAVDNDADAPDRTVTVSGAVSLGGVSAPADATLTILDDDTAAALALEVDATTMAEDGGTVTVTVTTGTGTGSTFDSARDITLVFAGTATEGGDYTVSATELTLPAGASGVTATLTALDDDVFEGGETVVISGLHDGAPFGIARTVTITDDEAAPEVTLLLAPASIGEDGGMASVTASVAPASSEAFTVTVSALAVEPGSSSDFTLAGATLSFAADATESTGGVTITAVDNEVDAPDKSVTVSGAVSLEGVTAPAAVTLTIADDDEPAVMPLVVTLLLAPASIGEDGGMASVTASVAPASAEAFTVTVSALAVEPGSSSDFTLDGATLSFAADATESTGGVTITAVDNEVDAPDKSVTVSGAVSLEGVTAPAAVTLTIADDDEPAVMPLVVTLLLTPASIGEDGGMASVTASVAPAASEAFTVTVSALAVEPGSSSDFTLDGATLSFAADATESTGGVTITAVDNEVDAPDKSVTVSGAVSLEGVTAPAAVTLTIADDDEPPVMPPPVERGVEIAPTALTIGEGDGAGGAYTAKLVAEPTADVTVTVSVPSGAGLTVSPTSLTFTADNWETARTVTVTAGIDDDADDRTVTITHSAAGGGYGDVTVADVSVTITDLVDPMLPAVGIADARGREAGGQLVFEVTIDRVARQTVSVEYATLEGTARAGEDYEAVAGTATIAAGETGTRIVVPLLVDVISEPDETFTVTLGGADGARLADTSATGTIEDPAGDGAAPQQWLGRFGRIAGSQVMGIIGNQIASTRDGGPEVSIAGRSLFGDAGAGSADPDRLFGRGGFGAAPPDGLRNATPLSPTSRHWRTQPGARPRGGNGGLAGAGSGGVGHGGPAATGSSHRASGGDAMNLREVLANSAFLLSAGSGGGGFAVWGRGAYTRFDNLGGGLETGGDAVTATLGVDWSCARCVFGVAVSQTRVDATYGAGGGESGDLESTITGLYPYFGARLTERLSVWGLVGQGEGELLSTPANGATVKVDLESRLAGLGARGDLLVSDSGFTLALKTDALVARTTTDEAEGLLEAEGEYRRLRLGLEGSWLRRFGEDASLRTSLEVAAREDAGDDLEGLGVEVRGGLEFIDVLPGLSLDVDVHGLVSHDAGDSDEYEEWGVSGGFRYDPRPETAAGPLVSLVHSWSPADSVGLGQALWRNDPARRGPAGASTGRGQENLSAEFAWGFETFGALSVPWARMGNIGAGGEYRLGYSLLTGRGIPSLEFGESAFGREYALGWEFSLRCRIQVAVRMTHGTGLPGDRSDTGLRIGFRSIMPRRASGGSPGGASCGMAQPLFQSGASSLGPALP